MPKGCNNNISTGKPLGWLVILFAFFVPITREDTQPQNARLIEVDANLKLDEDALNDVLKAKDKVFDLLEDVINIHINLFQKRMEKGLGFTEAEIKRLNESTDFYHEQIDAQRGFLEVYKLYEPEKAADYNHRLDRMEERLPAKIPEGGIITASIEPPSGSFVENIKSPPINSFAALGR